MHALPLLGALLGISIPDNELTALFDAELRKTSLEALLVECLRARAAEEPLVLVLEDCHWIDALSRDLLEILARTVSRCRAGRARLSARRRSPRRAGARAPTALHGDPAPRPRAGRGGAADRLQIAAGAGGADTEVPAALTELVVGRAEGNPFYIEELLNYIQARAWT